MKQKMSPDGARIIGTFDVLYGVANINGFGDGGEPEFEGYTEVDWDSQVTVTRKSTTSDKPQRVFVDDGGEEWTEDQLVDAPEDDDA